jgi:hypothetical protein
MVQPYLRVIGLPGLSGGRAKDLAREFVLEWHALSPMGHGEYALRTNAMIDKFLGGIDAASAMRLPAIVSDAMQPRNVPREVSAWQSVLCNPRLGKVDSWPPLSADHLARFAPLASDWCISTAQSCQLLDEMTSTSPLTNWDVWLCSPKGFYGDDEFLAMTSAAHIGFWQILDDLRTRIRAIYGSDEVGTILMWAREKVSQDDDAEWFQFRL